MITPEVRQLRYVVEVARQGSFSRAAERLHVAQQALSQQVRVVEDQIGVRLFDRTNRGVVPTAAGVVFVAEARKAIAAAERVVPRTQAAARGEAGSVRIAYTLTSVYETLPAILERLAARHPLLKVAVREVYGGDVERLLADGGHDLALCPRMALGRDVARRELRREPFMAAVGEGHRLASAAQTTVADLRDETIEVWPREMAPGYHDAVVAACRAAGFEPRIDEHAAGSTVWGSIAQGRGVGLVVRSLVEQLPRGVVLVALAPPAPRLTVDLVWHEAAATPAIERVLDAATAVGAERGWLLP